MDTLVLESWRFLHSYKKMFVVLSLSILLLVDILKIFWIKITMKKTQSQSFAFSSEQFPFVFVNTLTSLQARWQRTGRRERRGRRCLSRWWGWSVSRMRGPSWGPGASRLPSSCPQRWPAAWTPSSRRSGRRWNYWECSTLSQRSNICREKSGLLLFLRKVYCCLYTKKYSVHWS